MNNGTYRIDLYAFKGTVWIAEWLDLLVFEVYDVASDARGLYHDWWPGALRPHLEWKTELLEQLGNLGAEIHARS